MRLSSSTDSLTSLEQDRPLLADVKVLRTNEWVTESADDELVTTSCDICNESCPDDGSDETFEEYSVGPSKTVFCDPMTGLKYFCPRFSFDCDRTDTESLVVHVDESVTEDVASTGNNLSHCASTTSSCVNGNKLDDHLEGEQTSARKSIIRKNSASCSNLNSTFSPMDIVVNSKNKTVCFLSNDISETTHGSVCVDSDVPDEMSSSYPDRMDDWQRRRKPNVFHTPLRKQHTLMGTPDYLAPELINGKDHGPEVDWWALGVCYYEFICGIPPFNDLSPEAIFQNIIDHTIDWPTGESHVSPAVVRCIESLLEVDPANRPNALTLKAMECFESINWDGLRNQTPPFMPHPDNETDTGYFEAKNKARELNLSMFQ